MTANKLDTYLRDNNDLIVNQVITVVTAGYEWRDVVSSNMVSPRVDAVKSKLNPKFSSKYRPSVLKSDIAIINFLILSYRVGTELEKEVFFGFGLHEKRPADFTFATKNREVVSFFEEYFAALRTHANRL